MVVVRVCATCDVLTNSGDELHVVVEVVRLQQDVAEQLMDIEQVMNVGSCMVAAGVALTAV